MRLHVDGDGQFLALIDSTRYPHFVHGDLDEEQRLVRHVQQQMEKGTVLAWGTGLECDWPVEVREGITSEPGFRAFEGGIHCSSGEMYLANFDSLTMGAQFEHHSLPDDDMEGCGFALANGDYRVRVVQMVDPRSAWWDTLGESPAFVIEFERASALPAAPAGIPWAQGLL